MEEYRHVEDNRIYLCKDEVEALVREKLDRYRAQEKLLPSSGCPKGLAAIVHEERVGAELAKPKKYDHF